MSDRAGRRWVSRAHRAAYDDALRLAPWVEALDERHYLQQRIVDALIARRAAIRAGADGRRIDAIDRTLDPVRLGTVSVEVACRAASKAIDRYDAEYTHAAMRTMGYADAWRAVGTHAKRQAQHTKGRAK